MQVRGNEVRVGDEIDVFGYGPSVVKSLRPYRGPLLELLGEGTQLAEFAGRYGGMTLAANSYTTVTHRAN